MEDKNMSESSFGGGSIDFKLLMALGAVATISFFAVFYFYRLNFSGAFSTVSGDWSDFGGYFGGVLGPIVSMLTLVTIFKTILLQREMIRLQGATFKSQMEQVERLSLEAKQARLDSRKSALLDVIDRLISSLIMEIESMESGFWKSVQLIDSASDLAERETLRDHASKTMKLIGEFNRKKLIFIAL